MNKKVYEKPSIKTAKMVITSMICVSGGKTVTDVEGGDTGIDFGGGGTGPARAPQRGTWGDLWDDFDSDLDVEN